MCYALTCMLDHIMCSVSVSVSVSVCVCVCVRYCSDGMCSVGE